MQVVFTVTKENINENGSNFSNCNDCPIAVSLRSVLDESVCLDVTYRGIQLTYGEMEDYIPFPETVPDIYKSSAGGEDQEEDPLGDFLSPLVPFTSILEIPIDYIKEELQNQDLVIA